MTTEAPRGYAKGRARRAELIEAAMALFGEVGYRSASLREIAGRCGISHAGLLHHFPNKEALLVAVLQHRDDEDRRHFEPELGGVALLAKWVDLADLNATRPRIVELFTVLAAEATATDHPAHDWFEERYRESVRHAEYCFRKARADGVLQSGVVPAAAARQLVALMDGLQVQWLLHPDDVDMGAVLRTHLAAQLTAPMPRRRRRPEA